MFFVFFETFLDFHIFLGIASLDRNLANRTLEGCQFSDEINHVSPKTDDSSTFWDGFEKGLEHVMGSVAIALAAAIAIIIPVADARVPESASLRSRRPRRSLAAGARQSLASVGQLGLADALARFWRATRPLARCAPLLARSAAGARLLRALRDARLLISLLVSSLGPISRALGMLLLSLASRRARRCARAGRVARSLRALRSLAADSRDNRSQASASLELADA